MSRANFETCHPHLGALTDEVAIARELLRGVKEVRADTIKELRDKTDIPLTECGEMLRCLHRDMEVERLNAENAKLIEFASAMYRSILLVPDNHIPAEIKARYFEVAVSLGLDVPDE